MKGYRFFREHDTAALKRKGAHNGNVVAVWLEQDQHGHWGPIHGGQPGNVEAFVAVLAQPDSPVCGSTVAREYLREQCTRVSEAEARTIHPALFAYLDNLARQEEAEEPHQLTGR